MFNFACKGRAKKVLSAGLLVVMVIFVALSAAGCGSSSQTQQAADKTYTLSLANSLAIGTYQNTTLLPAFVKNVNEKTNGKVTINLYPGGQLFKQNEIVDALSRGVLEMGYSGFTHFTGFSLAMGFNNIPFLVPEIDSLTEHYDELFAIADQVLSSKDIKLLAIVPYSSSTIISKKPIEKPADTVGLRMRAPADSYYKAIQAWGGSPTSLSTDECYDALSKGALDCDITGWDSVRQRKLFEVTDYAVGPTNASFWSIVMSKKTWESLPQDIQQALMEAAKTASIEGIRDQKRIDQEAIEALKAEGMKVKVLTPAENEAWKQATQSAIDDYVAKCEANGQGDVAKKLMALYQ